MGRRKNIICRSKETTMYVDTAATVSGIDQNMMHSDRKRFFFQPISNEYLAETSTQNNENNAAFQQAIAGTTEKNHDDDADLYETIADMLRKRKHDSIDKCIALDQAEPSSFKRSYLSAGTSHQCLQSHELEMRENKSSDDEALEDSDNEDVHRIVSGLHGTIYGQASYQRTQSTYPAHQPLL